MIISKVWAMPNARTFSIRPITAFVESMAEKKLPKEEMLPI